MCSERKRALSVQYVTEMAHKVHISISMCDDAFSRMEARVCVVLFWQCYHRYLKQVQ